MLAAYVSIALSASLIGADVGEGLNWTPWPIVSIALSASLIGAGQLDPELGKLCQEGFHRAQRESDRRPERDVVSWRNVANVSIALSASLIGARRLAMS